MDRRVSFFNALYQASITFILPCDNFLGISKRALAAGTKAVSD